MPRPDSRIQHDLRQRFAVSFKKIRIERGWSMGEMGRRLDMSVPMIMKYERGISLPSYESMVMIARRLAVSLDELMGISNLIKASTSTKK